MVFYSCLHLSRLYDCNQPLELFWNGMEMAYIAVPPHSLADLLLNHNARINSNIDKLLILLTCNEKTSGPEWLASILMVDTT